MTTLSHHSLWLDETFSIAAATGNTARTILTTGIDPVHPPLYYAILRWCLALTGVNEITARLPSAISAVAAVALVYWLGEIVFPSRTIGRLAAVLLALSPIHFWYAQEARMYSMVATAGLALAIGFFKDRWWASPFIVGGLAGGLYLDHTMWPLAILILTHWLVWWFHRGRPRRAFARVGLAAVAAGLLCRPVYAQALSVYSQLNGISFFNHARDIVGLTSLTAIPFAWALAAFAGIGLTVAGLGWSASRQPTLRRWLAYATTTGFAASTALVAVPRAYGLKQILVCFWPFFALLAAWAATSIDRRLSGTRVPTTGVLIAVSICALSATFATPRADWRGVAAHLATRDAKHSVVVIDPSANTIPYSYYRPRQPSISGPVASGEAIAVAGSEINEACLIAERFGRRPPTSPSEAWLDTHFTLISATSFPRLELRCYRLAPR